MPLFRLGIHLVVLHEGIELFAVLLLFPLDVGEDLTGDGVGEFKDTGVIEGGGVLFGGKHILAEEGILLAVVLGAVGDGGAVVVVGVGDATADGGDGAAHHLLDGF